MSEINKIIDNFFEVAAKSIMRNIADGLLENPRKNKGLKQNILDVIVAKGYSTIEVQEKYLELLDEIDRLVYGEIDKKNSYVSYYKGNELFQTDVNISDIIEKVKQSSNSGDIVESLKEDVKKRLLEKNGYRRIAQLYYYKKNHRRYEEELEKAYREIVSHVIKRKRLIEKSITVENNKKIRDITQGVVYYQAEKEYEKIYENAQLPKEYKVKKSAYYSELNNQTELYIYKTPSNFLESEFIKYRKEINKRVRQACFLTISECYEKYSDKYKNESKKVNSIDTYRRFLKNTLAGIAGFEFNIDNTQDFGLKDRFILKTLCPLLNSLTQYYYKKFKAAKQIINLKGNVYTRFEHIHSLKDFYAAHATLKLFIAMIASNYLGVRALKDIFLAVEEAEVIYSAEIGDKKMMNLVI